MSQNFDTFNTPHDALFLVFGVPNAKYLAFGTPDGDALNAFIKHIVINVARIVAREVNLVESPNGQQVWSKIWKF